MTDVLVPVLAALAGALITWLVLRASRTSVADARALHAEAAAANARAGAAADALAQATGELEELRRELSIAQRGKAVAETRAEQIEIRSREQVREFASAHKQVQDAFKALASDALDASTTRLLALAEERFRTMQEQASGELRARTDAIGALVTPLAEKLTEYQRQTQAFAETSQRGLGEVGQHLREVVAATGHAAPGDGPAGHRAADTARAWPMG